MEFVTAAIALGFLGSFHCIGMCGPIALALPVHNQPPVLKYALIALYNLGRIFTYSIFGIIAGVIGKGIILAGYQQALSIAVGILLLLSVFLHFENSMSSSKIFFKIKTNLGKAFSKSTKPSLFIIGMLNGFLPCGLVYAGIAGAAASGGALQGFLFMTAFGLGTMPMMYIVPLIGNKISISSRNKIRRATPVIVTAMALMLIVRGLNLGIPYISPEIDRTKHTMNCHENYPDKSKLIKCEKPSDSKDSKHYPN